MSRRLAGLLAAKAPVILVILGLSSPPAPIRAQALSEGQLERRLHNPDALWNQVQACLKEELLAPPCMLIDRWHRYVILHDIDPTKKDAYLILPTFRVTGIEDPKAWIPPVAEFWAYGWEAAKRFVGKPAVDMGLAINSIAGRGQNQLHIHITCAKPAVRDALENASIPTTWKLRAFTFDGDDYDAIKVPSLQKSPFSVLQDLDDARHHMGAQSLAMIGSADGGFYLLDTTTTKSEKAEAEELLDETCKP